MTSPFFCTGSETLTRFPINTSSFSNYLMVIVSKQIPIILYTCQEKAPTTVVSSHPVLNIPILQLRCQLRRESASAFIFQNSAMRRTSRVFSMEPALLEPLVAGITTPSCPASSPSQSLGIMAVSIPENHGGLTWSQAKFLSESALGIFWVNSWSQKGTKITSTGNSCQFLSFPWKITFNFRKLSI